MKKYVLTDWQDYWIIFEELIELLNTDNKCEIIFDFKKAQKYVNGLTDGLYEFKIAFEKAHKSNRHRMTDRQNGLADLLMTALTHSLANR